MKRRGERFQPRGRILSGYSGMRRKFHPCVRRRFRALHRWYLRALEHGHTGPVGQLYLDSDIDW